MPIDYKLFFELGDDFTVNELNKAFTNKYNNLITSTLSDIEKNLYKKKLYKIYNIAKKNNNLKYYKNNIIFNDDDNIIFIKNQQLYHKIELLPPDINKKINLLQSNINKNKKISFALN